MIYITTALQYLSSHIWTVVIAMGAIYCTYIAVNILFSPYIAHNSSIRRSIVQLRHTATTGKIVPFVASVPLEYRGQWHCYTTAHSVPAVSMFTPLQQRRCRRAGILLAVSYMVALLCMAIAILHSSNRVAMYGALLYVVAIFPVCMLLRWVRSRQYQGACRLFGRWVALVQAYFGSGDSAAARPANSADIEDMIDQLNLVKRCDKADVPAKVASILSTQPQDVERTVSQQRRINNALNELLVIGG